MSEHLPRTRAERLRLGTQQRREQEKQELRRTILEAAGELFLKHGYEGFSLRHVAEHIGYSPGTIYLYFKDKDDLLFTVADEGFARFGQQLAAAADSVAEPAERLAAMARAYVKFGLQNPAYYELMFIQRTDYLINRPETDLQPRINAFLILQRAVEEAMAAGVIRPGNPTGMSDVLWTMFHGIVALAIRMPKFFDPDRTQQAVDLAIEVMTKGIQP